MPGRRRLTASDFLARVERRAGSECWPWRGARKGRYGGFGEEYAHRVAYLQTNGPIPEGMSVCHTCDNPKCCNPAHLFLGTQTDNMRDASRKGRTRKTFTPERTAGERNCKAKLTASQVAEIKRLAHEGAPATHLARQFGVTGSLIGQIARGVIWKHVTPA